MQLLHCGTARVIHSIAYALMCSYSPLFYCIYRWLKHQVVHFYRVASSSVAAPVTWAKLTVAYVLSARIIELMWLRQQRTFLLHARSTERLSWCIFILAIKKAAVLLRGATLRRKRQSGERWGHDLWGRRLPGAAAAGWDGNLSRHILSVN